MKITRKLAAMLAVFILSLSLFCTVAYAEPAEEQPGESSETTTAPDDDFVVGTLPPGSGTVVDVFEGEDGRKFYTIQTPAGNTFYLIIDMSRLSENVYFLDAVQEKDLIALAEKAKNSGGESAIPGDTNANGQPNNNGEPKPGNTTDPKTEPKSGTDNIMMFVLVLVVLAVGGGAYFLKSRKKKTSNDSRAEYEDDEDEYIPDDYDTDPEDDSPPWEDEDE